MAVIQHNFGIQSNIEEWTGVIVHDSKRAWSPKFCLEPLLLLF